MKKLLVAIALATSVGCMGGRALTPVETTVVSARGYGLVQTAAAAYVTTPTANPDAKAWIKLVDAQILQAFENASAAAVNGDPDLARYYTNVAAGLITQLRGYLVGLGVEVEQ